MSYFAVNAPAVVKGRGIALSIDKLENYSYNLALFED
jgi:hypothetical protein